MAGLFKKPLYIHGASETIQHVDTGSYFYSQRDAQPDLTGDDCNCDWSHANLYTLCDARDADDNEDRHPLYTYADNYSNWFALANGHRYPANRHAFSDAIHPDPGTWSVSGFDSRDAISSSSYPIVKIENGISYSILAVDPNLSVAWRLEHGGR